MANLNFKAGTRSSKLARVQTRNALDRLEAMFAECTFGDVALSSPGDRDLQTDLRETPGDFFTQDLDRQVLDGTLDCAVHSAKDLPDPVSEGLDWFWLPWRADPRDAIILAPGRALEDLPPDARIGVSSDRREAYCHAHFPDAQLCTIRGNIEERLQQLDSGDFDMVIMAAAALVRLDLTDRIASWITLDDLPPPDGQGFLAVTFRAGDERFLRIRSCFCKAVTFAAGGIGSGGTCTLDVLKALRECDVCLHDALMGPDLLDHILASVERIHVGKRAGRHSLPQPEITALVARYARRGLRTVRLKGGDPGVFGRLAEEVETLDALHLPYRTLPGVSSLTAATTGTGMLLTRRGLSRGFCTMTPRMAGGGVGSIDSKERAALPIVFYMAVSVSDQVARELIDDGVRAETPAAIVFNAGSDQARVVSGTLADIGAKAKAEGGGMPGLFVVGEVTRYRYHTEWGAMQGRRILLTCSQALQDSAARLVTDCGGVAVARPLIRLEPTADGVRCIKGVADYDWVVLTSPSAVRCFGDLLRRAQVDLRSVPKLVTCGGGTTMAVRELGLNADIEPASDFGAEGLADTVKELIAPGLKILRLRSDKAGPDLAERWRNAGATVDDCVIYSNEPVAYEQCPDFDAVFFASASAVEAFDDLWGSALLDGKTVTAIGRPTLAALEARKVAVDLVGPEATVESTLTALATTYVRTCLTANKEIQL
ncbi:MAG: hydroxymethylbilane synthase [Kiritimatiellia bacterium]|jgi:uroporphyrinogen III methyltransferase/synthase|nr:hydroxymethylbilane synthase [Kiritimatiellia bacterium]MDP6630081.1 hydroxymethylbilane synthase [Kiritimatiellia bacterium]MDP6811240.1 hydroxymethylbilane synthase [Kiritimatiellia bacterium]MDP7024587.1 hydroxymethylbilane synthase [Kiritimatiellia bacterium]